MKKKILFSILLNSFFLVSFSQVGIGTITPDTSSILDLSSTNQGFLMPRMTSAERIAISSPVEGLEVYDTSTNTQWYFNGSIWVENTTIGASDLTDDPWLNNGTRVELSTLADGISARPAGTEFVALDDGRIGVGTITPSSKLHVNGNSDATQFVITANATQTNSNPLFLLEQSDGTDLLEIHSDDPTNTFVGLNTGNVNSGTLNTFIGSNAGNANTSGQQNTFIGTDTGNANATNSFNTFVGAGAGKSNISNVNTFFGHETGREHLTGSDNTFFGAGAGKLHTVGENNTFIGTNSGGENLTGNDNLFVGDDSGRENDGSDNTFIGRKAGKQNDGSLNVFIGQEAGSVSTGSNKLYIENTTSNTPLIYGEFDTDIVRVNGVIQSGDPSTTGYAFPAADGTANQVQITDGSGAMTWGDNVQKIDDLSDAKSDSDGSNDGSSIFLGIDAGLNDDSSDNKNIGIGFEALKTGITAGGNIAIGYQTLQSTTAGNSIAIGYQALKNNTTQSNIGIGFFALRNTTSNSNIGIGNSALSTNSTGSENLAIGTNSLTLNSTGYRNTAAGYQSMLFNSTGYHNTAYGMEALVSNSTGHHNTSIGLATFFNNSTGFENVALGALAGYDTDGSRNVFIGYRSGSDWITDAKTGSVFIGYESGSAETNDDRLYIENTNSTTPLIYGEFDTDLLRINGALQVGDPSGTGFSFPIIDGSLNQVITTDGNGSLSWVNSTSSATKINDLTDAKSDNDGSNDGSSIFIGIDAGLNDISSNNKNVGVGYRSLYLNTTGNRNAANGYQTLYLNLTGSFNTADGYQSLYSNTGGSYNTAIGYQGLRSNTLGHFNTTTGYQSLFSNITGEKNTADGFQALFVNTTGSNNTAAGYRSLFLNTLGLSNVVMGYNSLYDNTTGNYNVAIGESAGNNTNGNNNVFLGFETGSSTTDTKDGSVFIGYQAGYSENNSDRLYIENSNSTTPLIYGEFDTDIVEINGDLGIGITPARKLHISDVMRLEPRAAAPSSPSEGDIYVNSTDHHIYCYLNGLWKQLD